MSDEMTDDNRPTESEVIAGVKDTLARIGTRRSMIGKAATMLDCSHDEAVQWLTERGWMNS